MLKTTIRRYLVASLAAVVVFVGLVIPASPASALYALAAAPTPVCTTASGVTTCTETFAYSAADAYEWTPPAGIDMTVTMWGGAGGGGGSDTDHWCDANGGCGVRGGSGGYGSEQLAFPLTTDGSKITAAPGGAGGGGATDATGNGGGGAGQNYFTTFNGGQGGPAGPGGWSGAGGGGGAATVLKLGTTTTYIAGGGGGGVGGNVAASATPGAMQGYRNDAISAGKVGATQIGDGGGAGGGGGGLVGGLGGIVYANGGERTGTVGNTGLSKYPAGAVRTMRAGHGGITFTWTKIAQTGFTETAAASTLTYLPASGAGTTVSTTGGQSTGAVTYATSTSAICSVNATTGVVTALTAGNCVVTATKAADLKYDAATASTTIVIGQNDQAALVANAAAFNVTYPTGTTVTVTGGSGTGAVTYSSNTPAVCTVNASSGVVTDVTAGTCQILATKAADGNYTSPATDTVDILINKATQTITGSVAPTAIAFTATATANVTAGLGTGANTYTISTPTICSIDQVTRVITPITTGTCVFTVTKASDAKYTLATSAAVTLTINKATQTTLVAAADLAVISDSNLTDKVSATGGSGTGAVTYATTTPVTCSVNSTTGVITPVAIAPAAAQTTCTITATKAADANFNAATSAAINVVIRTEDQAALIEAVTSSTTTVPTTVTVSVPATGTVGGGNGTGAVTFASLTPTICSVAAGTGIVTPLIAGTCQIVATRAGDATWAPEVSTPIDIVISKGTQASPLNIGLAASVTFPTTATASLPAAGAVGGGTGTGAVTFATSTPLICSVNATTGVITPLSAGNCSVSATRAASDAYLGATSPEEILVINKAAQTALVALPTLALIVDVNVTDNVTTTGGSGSGAVTFATSTPATCAINATTGVITPVLIAAGGAQTICTITATKAADSQYNAVTSAAVNVTIKTDVQAALVLAGPQVATVPTTVTETATGGSGTGAITYAAADTTICTVVATTGVVTPIKAGNCVITATKAADANYIPVVSNSVTIVVSKGAQAAPLNIGLATTVTYPTTTTATLPAAGVAGGGTGTGVVSFATSTPLICSVNATTGVVTPITSGDCKVSATRAATDSYLAATSPEETLVIAKAYQAALTATVTPTGVKLTATATVDTPDTGTGSGSTTGAVTFATTTPTICSVNASTGVVTPILVGTCTLNATKAGSDLYNPVTSANVNLTITKGDQAALVASLSKSTTLLGSADAITVSAPATGTGSGSGTGAISYASSTPLICTVNATTGVITVVAYGQCSLTATKATDTLYLAQTSAAVVLTINRPAQAALTLELTTTATPAVSLGVTATLNFGDYIDSAATGGTGAGAITYAVATGTDFCVVDATTGIVTPVKAGTCTIQASKAGTAAVLPVTSNSVTVNVVKGAQDPLAVTLSAATTTFPTTVTASVPATGTTNGGNGTGAVTFASTTPTICTVDATTGVITPVIAGTCKVTATRAGTDYFNPITSAEATVTIAKAAQPLALTISPASATIGLLDGLNAATTVKLTVGTAGVAGGGNGTGAVTFTSTGAGCSVNATTGVVTPLVYGGTCAVTATRAGDGAYLDKLSSNTVTVTVKKAQATLTLTTPVTTTPFGVTVQAATTGAATGALTYASANTAICTVSATGLITPVTVGSCAITATRAGDATYAPAISNTVTVAITKALQAALAITAPVTGTSVALTGVAPTVTVPASGVNAGSGTGAKTFATSTPTVCSIEATTGALTLLAAGDCRFTVTKASDANYAESTSAPVTVTVTKGSQGTLVASANPSSIAFSSSATVTTPASGEVNGGKGTGALSFAIDPTTSSVCSVNPATGVVTPLSLTSGSVCKVIATRAADANYNAVSSTAVSITITKGTQSPLTLSASILTIVNLPGAAVTMSVPVSGAGSGSGTGAVTYSVTGTGCAINATTGVLTATDHPDCVVTATKAADVNYNVATSNNVTVSFTKALQATLTVTATPSPATYAPNGTVTLTVPAAGLPGGGSGTGLVTYTVDSSSAQVCSVNSTTGVVTTLAAGNCLIVATRAEDATYEPISDDISVVINLATQAPLTLAANKASVSWKDPGTITATVPTFGAGQGSGTGEVTYRSNTTNICIVDSSTGEVTIANPVILGSCSITAFKAADSQYKSAVSEPVLISITKATQDDLVATTDENTIAFGQTGLIEAPLNGEESGSGTGQITYVVSDSTKANCSVNLVTGEITPKTIGACSVYATKAADDLYAAVVSNVVDFTIVKGDQIITFVTVNRLLSAGKFVGDAKSSLATASIIYVSSTPATCTVVGNAITPKALGACTLVVSAAGTALYNAAPDLTKTFQIIGTKLSQTLTHTAPPATSLAADDVTLNAVLSSGAIPVITVKPDSTAVCSVVAGKLHGLKAGTCNYTVAGSAIGAYNALAAAPFTTSFTAEANVTTLPFPTGVSETEPRAITITDDLIELLGESSASLDVSYTTADANVCWVDSDGMLHLASVGTCSITASSGDQDHVTSVSATRTFKVTKSSQTLTFTMPGNTILGSDPLVKAEDAIADATGFKLSATLSSGLEPVYRSLDPDICTVEDDGTVTWNGDLSATPAQDTCRVGISHPGNASYDAVPEQVKSIRALKPDVETAPPGGVMTEPAVKMGLPRTGGKVTKGGISFNVGITSKTFVVKPQSGGLYIGPITADIIITYQKDGVAKSQSCFTGFGIVAKDTKGKLILDVAKETPASVKAVTKPYLAMPKYKTGGKAGYLDSKVFTNSASCTLNPEAFAFFKAGGVISAKAVVVRDRRWPTTYKRAKPNGTPIYPTTVVWNLDIG